LVLGNVDTSWLPVYSGGELLKAIDVDEGGPIPPGVEDKSGLISEEDFDWSSSGVDDEGRYYGGKITIDGQSYNVYYDGYDDEKGTLEYTINGQSYYGAEIEGKRYYVPATKTWEDTATFTFTVDGDLGTVENIDVRFSAAHTNNGHLDVSLESPQGKEVQLFSGVGRRGENFQDTVLDDDASTSRSIGIGRAPFNGTYRPQESLADFNGENPNGTWTLTVKDTNIEYGNGTLYRAGETAHWGTTAIGTQLLLRNPLVQIAAGGNGGAINLEATHGDISVGNIRSLSETANGGRIDLNANKDIISGLINSSSERGNGGDVNLNAISGEISTFSLDTSSFDGDGGSLEMKALGDITTKAEMMTDSGKFLVNDYGNVENSSGGGGNAGNIKIESTEGSIDTTAGSVSARSVSGKGGEISISTISGNIETQSLDSRSNSWSGNSGNGGAIDLDAGGDITTQDLNSRSNSRSGNSGKGGEISISTISGNIETQSLASWSNSRSGNSGKG
ncbi:MAG: proprotein convertase P-domain-containing protein, partial [Trichodesmium sp. St18_bin1]|nr:proprotein convertase P-domain-containing protein [Trichodesmium sp. St18_bin1]